MALRESHLSDVPVHSACDSAVVGPMYVKYGGGAETWNALDGIFAACIVDHRTGEYTIARDPMGVCSLYWGRDANGGVWVASEMKALLSACVEVSWFPPGHYVRGKIGGAKEGLPEPVRWYKPDWLVPEGSPLPTGAFDAAELRRTLVDAVEKRLMADAPLGVLLSGGLDSSLVAAIASRAVRRRHAERVAALRAAARARGEPEPADEALPPFEPLKTFAIGVPGAPDLAAAREVAAFLGTDHHEFTFSPREGLDALEDVVWHIESVEQVRSAVPMYLLSRRIKAMGIKVVLSGEGSDEAFGGYLYFHKAPGARELHEETVRLLARLHQWDVLRANKAPFAFGVEARVPFLDKGLLAYVMSLDPALKLAGASARKLGQSLPSGPSQGDLSKLREGGADDAAPIAVMEKHLLRLAFDTPEDPYLPAHVLWRQKEQFSDGVGYSWVDALRDFAHTWVPDELWDKRAERYPEHTPRTREYYLLRDIFDRHFPHKSAFETVPKGLSIACSTPEAIAWDDSWAGTHEISGRAIAAVHESALGFRVKEGEEDAQNA